MKIGRVAKLLSILLLATVSPAVSADNSLEALEDRFRADVNVPLEVDAPGLLANDRTPVGARASTVLVEAPRNGELDLQPDGSFTYTADPDFSGTDRFTYRLVDGIRESEDATVSISVPEVTAESEKATISAEAFTGPRIAAITDFSETADGVPLFWEKAYYQDLDIADATPLEIPFGLNQPSSYDRAGTARYPLVIYLHGAGARRNWTSSDPDPDLRDHSLVDAVLVRNTARFFAKAAQTQPGYYAFVLAPQVPSTSKLWVGTGPDAPYTQTDTPNNTYSEYMHLLEKLIPFLTDSGNNASLGAVLGIDASDIDLDRILVVGDSDGAKGTWDILARQPSLFAGGIAAAGTGPKNKLTELRQTPLWTIHGILDGTVPNALPSESQPLGSGTLGMLALLDPSFDNTASTDLVYKDARDLVGDDPLASDDLIYSEFDETFNHSEVANGWTGMTSGILPWLFAQTRPANSPPVAEDQSVSTTENTPVAITLATSDPDGDSLTYSIVTSPSSGALSGTPPDLTYTPDPGFTGTDSLTFKASDGTLESNIATVTITVVVFATVPDIVGLTRSAAEDAIVSAGLTVGIVATDNSDTVPADSIISQNPAGGTTVAEGSSVNLVVSLGPAVVTVPDLVGEVEEERTVSAGDNVWSLPPGIGGELAVHIRRVDAPALSPYINFAQMPGQIVVDPQAPAWLKRNGGGPFFLAGPGDPENFLYRGVQLPDGTRDGDQMALIEKLTGTGANSIYLQAVRSHGGDGDATHNPFIGNDPAQGLNPAVLDQWESWFTAMDENDILIFFFFYDDSARIWNTGDNVEQAEQAFLEGLVDRFEHHRNLVWVVAEEYEERYTAARASNIAAVIKAADDYDHAIGIHKRSGLDFSEFADDPVIDQFAVQYAVDTPTAAHSAMVTVWNDAAGRYNINHAENHGYSSWSIGRQMSWASAMGGAYVMEYGMDIAGTSPDDLEDLGRLASFMAATDIREMAPHDELALAGSEYVLADPGNSYILYAFNLVGNLVGLADMTVGTYRFRWIDVPSGHFLTQTEAEDAIFAAQLNIGTVTTAHSDTVPAGKVIQQTPSAGAQVANGSTVDLVVSLGNAAPLAADDTFSVSQNSSLNSLDVLTNDTDPDSGDALRLTAVGGMDSGGTGVINGNGTPTDPADDFVDYTPAPDFSGVETFVYYLSDGFFSDMATVTVTVNDVNDPPVASDDAFSVDEDSADNQLDVLANDNDPDLGDILTLTAVGPTDNGGTAVVADNGTPADPTDDFIAYTPAPGFVGTETFSYTIDDAAALSDSATVTVTVNNLNDPPVAIDDAFSVAENSADNPLDVLTNDSDPDDGDTFTLTTVGPTDNGGTAVINDNATPTDPADDVIAYTPAPGFVGTETFSYTVEDTAGLSDSAAVKVTVNEVNDPPVANDDSYSVDEDTTLNVPAPGVLGNDTDIEGNPLAAFLVAQAANGTVSLNGDGSFSYSPNADFSGDDSFTYKANDGLSDGNTATVTVTVNNINDPPVAADDAFSVAEDSADNPLDVLVNDSDPDPGDTLVISAVSPTDNGGNAVVDDNGTPADPADDIIAYTPAAGFIGVESFNYTVEDAAGLSASATVTVTVNNINDPPVAVDDAFSVDEDSTANPLDVLANDSDPDGGDSLTLTAVGPTDNGGTAVVDDNGTPGDPADDVIAYTPAPGFTGNETFSYTIGDTGGLTASAAVTVSVNNVNDPPVANDDTFSVDENTTLNVPAPGVLGNDTDIEGNPLTAVLVTQATNGAVSLNDDGSFLYTPNADFAGDDSFTYKANDGLIDGNVATAIITVNNVNNPPVAADDAFSVAEDSANNPLDVLANDSDPDPADTLVISTVGSPDNGGTAVVYDNGTSADPTDDVIAYTPASDFTGIETFSYTVTDGGGSPDSATVTVTVTAANDPPVAVEDSYSVNEDSTLNVTAPGVLANDTDSEGDPLTAVLVTQAGNGEVALASDGSFVYTPTDDFWGTDSFTYRASDGILSGNTATVTVTVNPVNDGPVARDDAASTSTGTPVTIAVLTNDTDVDLDPLSVESVTQGVNGTVTNNVGDVTYTPNPGFAGADNFYYTASDGRGGIDTATVTVTVEGDTILFGDDFNRSDDAVLGNGWTEVEASGASVDISAGHLTFTDTSDQTNRPMTYHDFSRISSGRITWDFDFDWIRTGNESTYRLFMQLGDGSLMTAANQNDGVGVNLVWTKFSSNNETLGYRQGGNETPIISVSGTTHISVAADLTARSYSVSLDGTTVASGIPFDRLVDLDTVRFFTDALNEKNFSGLNFDNLEIRRPAGPGNSPPVAGADAYSVDEDTPLSVAAPGVLGNDIDGDGDPLFSVLVSNTSRGTLNLNPDGSFSYTPDADFSGSDSFTYQARDGTGESNIATVTITVNAINDPPAAADDSFSVARGSSGNTLTVLANDTDADPGDTLVITTVGSTDNGGTVAITAGGNALLYTPASGFTGLETFTYTVDDPAGESATATVSVTVAAETLLFSDDFNRPDGATVGNGWTEEENSRATVGLNAGRLTFTDTSDQTNLPMVTHSFTRTSSGKITWEFDFDWTRANNEKFYHLFMQLGDGNLMTTASQNEGIGVNLVWTEIGGTDERLGYREGGSDTALATVSGPARISVEADLAARTYTVSIDRAVVASEVPFDRPVDLDTVRFFTDGLNENKFSGRSFDDLVIRSLP